MGASDAAWAAIVATACALVVSGCGGSSDETTETAAGAGASNAKQQIATTFARWQKDFIAGRGDAACAKLTSSAKRDEVAQLHKIFPDVRSGASCPEALRAVAAATRRAALKQQPAVVVSVRVQGEEATAMVSDAGRPAQAFPFAHERGEWKLATAGFAGLLGQEP